MRAACATPATTPSGCRWWSRCGFCDSWGLYDPAGEVRGKTLGEGRSERANWFGLAACWALMLLAPLGVLALRRRGQPVFILLAPVLLVLLVSATSYGILRFRAPADVALVVLGAVALNALAIGGRPPARTANRIRPRDRTRVG